MVPVSVAGPLQGLRYIPTTIPTGTRSSWFAGLLRLDYCVMMSEDAKFALGF